MSNQTTTQELSKIEKQRLANRLSYQRYKQERIKAALETYNKNRDARILQMHQRYKKARETGKYQVWQSVYYYKNKKWLNNNAGEHYENNKKALRKKAQDRYQKDKEQILTRQRQWRSKNKDYYKNRYNTNSQYKLANSLRCRVYGALKCQGVRKNVKTEKLIGCTIEECKKYIESLWLPGMSWRNHALRGWHIDHIKPVNTFDLFDDEQQKQCFHYTNLRPLWATENLFRPHDGCDVCE